MSVTPGDEFESVRNDPDPIRRGRRATELMTIYQQRATELARLRRAAIDDAHQQLGLSYTDIAAQLGITKGRVTQIRSTAPPPERAFFGVGPVAIGIPRRYGLEEGRERPFFDAVDLQTQSQVEELLAKLSLAGSPFAIEPTTTAVPDGDAIIVCGPKSAPVARTLLTDDPALGFEQDGEGRWWITDELTGHRFDSPFRRVAPTRSDVGYFGRHLIGHRVVLHVAGVTSVGSLGVVHWLNANLTTLFASHGQQSFSGVVQCDFNEGLVVEDSRLVAGPYAW